MGINKAFVSGNLTRGAELRQTQRGTAVLSFTVAVNDRRKNSQTGKWEDKTNYVSCVMFGSRAEKLSAYLTKGTKVALEGKLSYSSWQAQDGSKRSTLEVLVDEIEFMSQRPQDQSSGPQTTPPAPSLYEEDCPF